jgi:hypothetical protein
LKSRIEKEKMLVDQKRALAGRVEELHNGNEQETFKEEGMVRKY